MSFHRVSATLAVLALVLTLSADVARAEEVSYFGRWTVKDTQTKLSSKGRRYKVIDIAPCDQDFCAVSVDDTGTCGKTLFRFPITDVRKGALIGYGSWGKAKKNLMIAYVTPDGARPYFWLGLGDAKMDFVGRGSLPTFEADYVRVSDAKCGLIKNGNQS
jgi:hypothetical protein